MISTLTGGNSYALSGQLKNVKTNFINKYSDLSVERLSAVNLTKSDLTQTLASLPFLADKKLVILEDLASNKELAEEFDQVIRQLPSSTDLVIYEPVLDKRLRLYKLLKSETDFKEFNQLDQHSLIKWALDYVKKQGGQISLADASLLIDQVGQDQQLLASELDKLVLYDQEVTKSTIELLIEPSPQSTIFQLIELALRGQAKQSIAIYRQQRQTKVSPRELIGLLTWQLHLLALVKSAGQSSPGQIAKQAGLNSYPVQKASLAVKQLTMARLRSLIKSLIKIDLLSKQTNLDLDEAVEDFILKLAGVIS